MAAKTDFKNGRISNFEGPVIFNITLAYPQKIVHGRTYVWQTAFIRSTQSRSECKKINKKTDGRIC